MTKYGFKKDLPALSPSEFFMCILLVSNQTVFLVQFRINLPLLVFEEAEIAIPEAGHAILVF